MGDREPGQAVPDARDPEEALQAGVHNQLRGISACWRRTDGLGRDLPPVQLGARGVRGFIRARDGCGFEDSRTVGFDDRSIAEPGTPEGLRETVCLVGEIGVVRSILQRATAAGTEMRAGGVFQLVQPNADRPVCARPRIRACTSWVPS